MQHFCLVLYPNTQFTVNKKLKHLAVQWYFMVMGDVLYIPNLSKH